MTDTQTNGLPDIMKITKKKKSKEKGENTK